MPKHAADYVRIGRDEDRILALADAEHAVFSVAVADDSNFYVANFFSREFAALLLGELQRFLDELVGDGGFIALVHHQQQGGPFIGPGDNGEGDFALW